MTRIDADGNNELILLIRATLEIRGFIPKAQKYSNSRADADTVGPGAIKNRDYVTAPKNQANREISVVLHAIFCSLDRGPASFGRRYWPV